MARALRVYEIGIIKAYWYCIITNTNMFHVGRFRLFHAGRRALRRERVFRDRTKPLDIYDDFELIDKYRFSRQSIMLICDMLQDDLESSTFRNRALTPNMKVFVALRFYASGSFQRVIADTFGLSQPSVSRAISDVSTALVKRAGNYISERT
jgi:hypothetical protein